MGARGRVSIVIPCFNHARFLPEAIESALAQTHPDVEVVVVDDGSTDGSADIASRYPVRLIRQPNGGLALARNAGLRASSGNTVIFLDADDRLRRDAAERGCAALERSPGTMMAFGRCQLIDEAGAPLATNLPAVRADYYQALLRSNYIWMPAMAAYRRGVFDSVGGFDGSWNAAADYDLYLRIASRFPIVSHDDVVADYRQHGSNMSRDPVLMLEASLAVLRRQRARARRSAALYAAWRGGMRHWREFYGEHLVERFRAALRTPGGFPEAVRCAYHLGRLYPRGALFHLWKKARLTWGRFAPRYAGRAMPAAEIATAISRASDSPGRR
jgi:glycosyltransferase involved in cell wall biosynthesis